MENIREVESLHWYDGKECLSIDSDSLVALVYAETSDGRDKIVMEINRRTGEEIARHNARYIPTIVFKQKGSR
jgi:hypothetical protein